MKQFSASIKITLRKGILDVQGKAVENALHSIDFSMITDVRIGKFVELNISAENHTAALENIDQACKKFIANPIIEDFDISIKEVS